MNSSIRDAAAELAHVCHNGKHALDDPLARINGYASLEFSANDYLQLARLERVRKVLQERMGKLFDRFDVWLLLLSRARQNCCVSRRGARRSTLLLKTPRARHPNESRAPDGVSSLCGLSALTVPCGFSKENLPYGLGFMARALQDGNILAAANLFQTHTDWHRQYPAIEA